MSKSTNNTAAAAATAKRVSKKSDVAVAPAAAVEVKPIAEKAVKKSAAASKPAAAAAVAPVAPAPVATAVAVEAAAVEQKTVEQEIAGLIATHQKIRDESVAAIKILQKLQKRVAKEVKEAARRRRRSKKEGEDGVPKEKRPTIFTTPVTLKDDLCVFLGKAKGSQMTPADVTRAFSAYVDSHKLKDAEKGHTIHPDAAMRNVLSVKDGEALTYRNIQSYLYKLYILPEKKKSASA
jgi:chromatin remodeling complex protein RSC6